MIVNPETFHEISRARIKAHEKHGENSIEAISPSDPRWLSILVEEVGEAAHELTYDATGSLRAELIDVLAVASAWVDSIDRDAARRAEDRRIGGALVCQVCGDEVAYCGELHPARTPSDSGAST